MGKAKAKPIGPGDPVIDPYAIYYQAMRFVQTAHMLTTSAPPQALTIVAFPAIVNGAFGTELLFKCLHNLRGKRAVGHPLKELFDLLDGPDRDNITQRFDDLIKHDPTIAYIATIDGLKDLKHDIRSVLSRCNAVFDIIRYHHENLSWTTSGEVGTSGMNCLMMAIRDVILAEHPEFKTRLESDTIIR